MLTIGFSPIQVSQVIKSNPKNAAKRSRWQAVARWQAAT
jgi:hypothetical protein